MLETHRFYIGFELIYSMIRMLYGNHIITVYTAIAVMHEGWIDGRSVVCVG